MLDNNIVLWSIRNKTSEKIVRLHHSKGVAIKGGGRPTRLLPHAKMLLTPMKLFLSAG